MKYLSIDTETSGLTPSTDELLSVAVVIEDTTKDTPLHLLPYLHIVIIKENISGSIFAINMNLDLIQLINKYNISTPEERIKLEIDNHVKFLPEDKVAYEILKFCYVNGIEWKENSAYNSDKEFIDSLNKGNVKHKMYLNVAGKNFHALDKFKLEQLPRWKQYFNIRSRLIDPAILFVDWDNDESLPGLGECLKRLGESEHVSHDAYLDAIDVIRLLRKSYQK